jgi:hypothetical protein
MSEQSTLAAGFFFERPKEGAPSFVKGKLSVQAEKAIEFINTHKNDRGYINLDLLEARETKKLYLALNTWKPETKPTTDTLEDSDVPF